MPADELIHVIHNSGLAGAYLLLGTVYFPGFMGRLDVPYYLDHGFRAFALMFFLLCGHTHLELAIHTHDLPPDYFTWGHQLPGIMQLVGAVGVLVILHILIFGNEDRFRKT